MFVGNRGQRIDLLWATHIALALQPLDRDEIIALEDVQMMAYRNRSHVQALGQFRHRGAITFFKKLQNVLADCVHGRLSLSPDDLPTLDKVPLFPLGFPFGFYSETIPYWGIRVNYYQISHKNILFCFAPVLR